MSDLKLCYGCMEPLGSDPVCAYCGYDRNATSLANYLKPGTMLHERFMVGKVLEANGESVSYLGYDSTVGCKILIREYFPERLCSRVPNSSAVNVKHDRLAQYKALMAEYTELNKALARMRNISHLNPALDMFAENNTTYAVYEYLEGRTLLEYLKENAGELSWNIVRRIFPPLFTTLSLLHNAGVLHRGLSPETIFVTERGELKLTGFCISAVRTNDTELDAELFDGYAAPEQYFADRQQGTWTDVYGICAVLYRILTGCRAADSISRQDYDSLLPPTELNPQVPENVSQAIMQGMMLDGSKRVRTVTDLVTLLFEEAAPEQPQQKSASTVGVDASKKNTTAVYPAGGKSIQPAAARSVSPQKKPAQSGARPAQGGRPSQTRSGAPSRQAASRSPQNRSAQGRSSAANRRPAAGKGKQKEQEITVYERIRAPLMIAFLFIAIVTVIILAFYRIMNLNSGDQTLSNSKDKSSASDNIVPAENDEGDGNVHYDSVIPDVLGRNFTIKRDEFAGWLELEPEYEFSDIYTKDMIFWQEFEEGTDFVSGSTMRVKVSLGSSIVTIPAFKGLRLQTYLKNLEEMGLMAAIDGGGNTNIATSANQTTPRTTDTNGQQNNQQTITTTTSKYGKVQNVIYIAKVDYNYSNGYVCEVIPEPGTLVDALDDYEIIVYYAYNPVFTTITMPGETLESSSTTTRNRTTTTTARTTTTRAPESEPPQTTPQPTEPPVPQTTPTPTEPPHSDPPVVEPPPVEPPPTQPDPTPDPGGDPGGGEEG